MKVWGHPMAEENTKEAGRLLRGELEEGPHQVLAGRSECWPTKFSPDGIFLQFITHFNNLQNSALRESRQALATVLPANTSPRLLMGEK